MIAWFKKILGLDGIRDREVYENTPDLQMWRAFDNGDDELVIRLVMHYKGLIDRTQRHEGCRLNLLEYSCLKGSERLVEFFIEYFYPNGHNNRSIHLVLDNNHLHCLSTLLDDIDITLCEEEIHKIQTSIEALEDTDLAEQINQSLERHLNVKNEMQDNHLEALSAPPGPQIIWRKALDTYQKEKLRAEIQIPLDKSYKVAV